MFDAVLLLDSTHLFRPAGRVVQERSVFLHRRPIAEGSAMHRRCHVTVCTPPPSPKPVSPCRLPRHPPLAALPRLHTAGRGEHEGRGGLPRAGGVRAGGAPGARPGAAPARAAARPQPVARGGAPAGVPGARGGLLRGHDGHLLAPDALAGQVPRDAVARLRRLHRRAAALANEDRQVPPRPSARWAWAPTRTPAS
ncbi:unnamed protein product [Prorocentrum cordatum]|uniref:Uncharacterized protein n=1 Tax=Prorocentrum cordatum TaxID=2364126 RepID=A0ABN9PHA7_9DINO|nr:unnamed protein product [Polarella glacialis]